MMLELLVMISLVVMGIYLLIMEYTIKKTKERLNYSIQTLHHLLIILESKELIELKEVGEDE